MTIRVLIADDHPLVRSGIRSEIAHDLELEVVGEAVNGDEALLKVQELCPVILLLDIHMPGMKTLHILSAL
jgi:YesN/AraC family two-component response regulator